MRWGCSPQPIRELARVLGPAPRGALLSAVMATAPVSPPSLCCPEVTLLEEELLPALKRFVARIADLDDWILVETELMQRCRLEDARLQITKLRPVLR